MPHAVWIHYARPRSHWYEISDTEKEQFRADWQAERSQAKEAGAAFDGRFHIRGQHDFETVEIWRFDTTVSAFDFWNGLCAKRYNEFFAFSNAIGLQEEEE
jgi:hypothetical protein|tara:strand:- start:51058 stop:51360 length:303 start_codon:yes stop_codon:yes gene_type:complete